MMNIIVNKQMNCKFCNYGAITLEVDWKDVR